MFEKMNESSGSVIGYRVAGTITKDDYGQLVPEVEALLQEEDSICMLLDMTPFKWEKVRAWGSDWRFGRDYHKKITKLAVVGDKKWEKWLTSIADPFYAQDAKYFRSADMDAAWAWLRE
jgi:hypothetical protein